MEEFFELVIVDSVPIIAETLGIPEETAELAVRHTFRCDRLPCEVEQYLNRRMLEATARNTGIPAPRLLELIESVAKGAGNTLQLRENMGDIATPDGVREVYQRGREALEAGMRLMMEEQK